jgi:hypothetical protein
LGTLEDNLVPATHFFNEFLPELRGVYKSRKFDEMCYGIQFERM